MHGHVKHFDSVLKDIPEAVFPLLDIPSFGAIFYPDILASAGLVLAVLLATHASAPHCAGGRSVGFVL